MFVHLHWRLSLRTGGQPVYILHELGVKVPVYTLYSITVKRNYQHVDQIRH